MNSDKRFPEVVQPSNDDEPPWGVHVNRLGWIETNMPKFLFQLEEIRGGAVEYSPPGDGPNGAGIYFLQFDGDVVYVGKSKSVAARLWTHFLDKSKAWTHFWCITGVPHEMLEDVEYMYIAWLKPILNHHCRGGSEIADKLIADLEPYRPFVAIRRVSR